MKIKSGKKGKTRRTFFRCAHRTHFNNQTRKRETNLRSKTLTGLEGNIWKRPKISLGELEIVR